MHIHPLQPVQPQQEFWGTAGPLHHWLQQEPCSNACLLSCFPLNTPTPTLSQEFSKAAPGLLPQPTCLNLTHILFSGPVFYYRSALSIMFLVRAHPKRCHKPGSVEVVLIEASTNRNDSCHRERGKKLQNQSDCNTSSRLRADIGSNCRPCPTTKISQKPIQGKHPAV